MKSWGFEWQKPETVKLKHLVSLISYPANKQIPSNT